MARAEEKHHNQNALKFVIFVHYSRSAYLGGASQEQTY